MLFTMLIYGAEGLAERLPATEQEALLQKHRELQAKLQAEGRLRGAVQLMPPSTAMNVLDKGGGVRVVDGPTPNPRSRSWASTSSNARPWRKRSRRSKRCRRASPLWKSVPSVGPAGCDRAWKAVSPAHSLPQPPGAYLLR